MKVFILTEGSRSAGLGHVSRCTALYQAFEAAGLSPRLIVSGDETAASLLAGRSYDLFDWKEDTGRLLGMTAGADIVVIDSYLAGPGLYREISETAGTAVYIDDDLRIDYPAGIVVNGTVFAERFGYPRRDGVVHLLGSRYAMLRREFWDVPVKEAGERVETVLITLGGDDARDLTPRILALLNERVPELNKRVIIGKGFREPGRIEALRDERTELIYCPDARGMRVAMLASDVAVSAAGQTLYELARVGVPTVAVAVADNQMGNVRGWLDAGFIEYAGWWSDGETLVNVVSCLDRLMRRGEIRERMSEAGRRLVDGRGARRIVRECIGQSLARHVTVREASYDDMYEVYRLSNEPDVRAVSFRSAPIAIEEHERWFVRKMQDGSSLLLVAECRGGFAGQVRFDVSGDEAVVSISLKRDYRGSGIGRHVLKKALSLLTSRFPGVRVVKAHVLKENAASLRFFENAGFRFSGDMVMRGREASELLFDTREREDHGTAYQG